MTLRHRSAARLFALPLAIALTVAAVPARAQDYGRPPPGFGDDRGDDDRAPFDAPDPAGLAVRIGKLEGRIREMTGQIEELQNANRKLVDQLQRFQADVDSRLTPGRAKRGDAGGAAVVGDAGAAPAGRRGARAQAPRRRLRSRRRPGGAGQAEAVRLGRRGDAR